MVHVPRSTHFLYTFPRMCLWWTNKSQVFFSRLSCPFFSEQKMLSCMWNFRSTSFKDFFFRWTFTGNFCSLLFHSTYIDYYYPFVKGIGERKNGIFSTFFKRGGGVVKGNDGLPFSYDDENGDGQNKNEKNERKKRCDVRRILWMIIMSNVWVGPFTKYVIQNEWGIFFEHGKKVCELRPVNIFGF